MSITFPLTPPSSPGPRKFNVGMVDVVAETISPVTLTEEEQQWPGARWEFEVGLPPMVRADAEKWIGFLGALGGKYGRFLMGDPAGQSFLGAAIQTGWIASLGISPFTQGPGTRTLRLRNISQPDIANAFAAGDYLQLTVTSSPQRLYKSLTSQAAAGGFVNLDIWPPIREAIPDGTSIVLGTTAGTFRLADNRRQWSIDEAAIYGLSFKAVEAIQNAP